MTDDDGHFARDGLAFNRATTFIDGVFAILLTLMAIEIAVPEIHNTTNPEELLASLKSVGPSITAYLAAFVWVGFYWRSNHQFINTLKGMTPPFIATLLVYLGVVGLLPFVAGTLGHYGGNPAAVAMFAVFAALMSATELILWVVAGRQGLFIHPLGDERKRKVFATSVAPIPAFLLSVPLAFVSTLAAVSCWVVVITVQGWIATHRHSHTQEVTA